MKMYVIVLFAVLSMTFMSCEKDEVIVLDVSQYPVEIVSYVTSIYPEDVLLQMIKEVDDYRVSYNVLLKSGLYLEFNDQFQLVDIDRN